MIWEDMLNRVLPYVSGCPDQVAVEHLREAAREFCRRTRLWQFESTPVPTIAGESAYQLDLDEGQEIILLSGAWVDGQVTAVVTAAEGRASLQHGTEDRFVYLDDPFDINVNPVPTINDLNVVVQMVVQPSVDSTDWPDDFSEYVPDIAKGAVRTLALLPRKEWTDRQVAADQGAMFNQRAAVVSIQVSRNKSSVARRARPRFL